FVDIGLKESGLVHISQMANRYIKSPYDVVSVGDVITVWVMEVKPGEKKISLSMIPPGQERRAGGRFGGPPRGQAQGPGGPPAQPEQPPQPAGERPGFQPRGERPPFQPRSPDAAARRSSGRPSPPRGPRRPTGRPNRSPRRRPSPSRRPSRPRRSRSRPKVSPRRDRGSVPRYTGSCGGARKSRNFSQPSA